jgi:hypothetical protein
MTEQLRGKSPEELRAELAAKRAELGDTVEELAHRVDVPAQVRAKKDDTLAKLQDAKVEASRRVHEGTEKVKAAIARRRRSSSRRSTTPSQEQGRRTRRRRHPPSSRRWTRPSRRARPSTPRRLRSCSST